MRHPDHDALRSTVRQWYEQDDPDMGYQAVERPWGVYLRNVHAPRYGQATLRNLTPADVHACIADVRRFYGAAAVMILIDDRAVADTVDAALVGEGCRRGPEEVFLAHVGPVPGVRPVAGVVLEPVAEHNLAEYAVTKLQAFSSDETSPSPDHVITEITLRSAEIKGSGRFMLARVGGEPVAVVGWYDGPDVHVFQLATRVPFRGRGIARYVLLHVLNQAYARGCHSVVINADLHDTPINLYRRLGFTDAIYWRRRYHLFPDA